jgi:hypothetical protein
MPLNNSGSFDESSTHWSLLVVLVPSSTTSAGMPSPATIFHLDSSHHGTEAANERAVAAMTAKLNKLLKR